MTSDYSNLVHIHTLDELKLYELIPSIVWIFDLDKHGWWWGNEAAIKFWGLDNLDQLINKDLSGDTQAARDRTRQTFDLARKNGLTIDPWTTYPNDKPKTLYMMHRAVLVGPDRHRAIIAFVNEQVDLGEEPENLLFVEAMRYTKVLVSSFTLEGEVVTENPAATEAYKHLDPKQLNLNNFEARFLDPDHGRHCLQDAVDHKGGQWTCSMNTGLGRRLHTLDIRVTRHPLNGEYILLVTEYDVTQVHRALEQAQQAQEKLRLRAHYDSVTGVASLNYLTDTAASYLARSERANQKAALMFLDLDGFKSVNDNWGHDAGDQVLKQVATRLQGVLRDADQLARVGGDEFVILLDNISEEHEAVLVAEKVLSEVNNDIVLDGARAKVGVSIGIALFPDHGSDIQQLIKAADSAMYKVKKSGKNSYAFAQL